MMQTIKEFPSVLKKYIDSILQMNFGELLIHFFELVILLLIASFLYIPIGLLKDLLFSIFVFFSLEAGDTLNNIVDLIIKVCSFIAFFLTFVYLFTKRYEVLKKEQEKEMTSFESPVLEEKESADLPKEK